MEEYTDNTIALKVLKLPCSKPKYIDNLNVLILTPPAKTIDFLESKLKLLETQEYPNKEEINSIKGEITYKCLRKGELHSGLYHILYFFKYELWTTELCEKIYKRIYNDLLFEMNYIGAEIRLIPILDDQNRIYLVDFEIIRYPVHDPLICKILEHAEKNGYQISAKVWNEDDVSGGKFDGYIVYETDIVDDLQDTTLEYGEITDDEATKNYINEIDERIQNRKKEY